MKKYTVLYWVFITPFLLFMLFSAYKEIENSKEAIDFMAHLGYPAYINPFLGVAKIAAAIAILVPGFPRIKEWAYAGLFFDLLGATYTFIATKQQPGGYVFMAILFALLFGAYFCYHKRLALRTANQ